MLSLSHYLSHFHSIHLTVIVSLSPSLSSIRLTLSLTLSCLTLPSHFHFIHLTHSLSHSVLLSQSHRLSLSPLLSSICLTLSCLTPPQTWSRYSFTCSRESDRTYKTSVQEQQRLMFLLLVHFYCFFLLSTWTGELMWGSNPPDVIPIDHQTAVCRETGEMCRVLFCTSVFVFVIWLRCALDSCICFTLLRCVSV